MASASSCRPIPQKYSDVKLRQKLAEEAREVSLAPPPKEIALMAKDLMMEKELGQGTFGVVSQFSVIDPKTKEKETWAIKDFNVSKHSDKKTNEEKFLNEVRVLSYLKEACDDYLCLTNFWKDGDKYYMGTRLHGNHMSLGEYLFDVNLEDRPFKLDLTLLGVITSSIACGLQNLHALGVAHYDLKPDNIMINTSVDGQGTCKIIDFDTGVLSVDTPLTYFGGGTVNYLPPERLKHDLMKPEDSLTFEDMTKFDLWALGCTCFDLMCGLVGIPENSLMGDLIQNITNESFDGQIDIEFIKVIFNAEGMTPDVLQLTIDIVLETTINLLGSWVEIPPKYVTFVRQLLMVNPQSRTLEMSLLSK
jgi:serine/threonine protein kinase